VKNVDVVEESHRGRVVGYRSIYGGLIPID